MQDREFEKQVRQKMQELRFAPNADVWARVQADIRKKKRRRPLIIFLLLAVIVAGTGMVYFGINCDDGKLAGNEDVLTNKKNISNTDDNVSKGAAKENTELQNKSTNQQQPLIVTDKSKSDETNDQNNQPNLQNTQPASRNSVAVQNKETEQRNGTLKNNEAVKTTGPVQSNRDAQNNKTFKNNEAVQNNATVRNKKAAQNKAPNSQGNDLSQSNEPNSQSNEPPLNETLKGNASWLHITRQPSFSIANPKPSVSFDSAKVLPLRPQEVNQLTDSLAKKPFGAKANTHKKKSWELGASAGIGYANAKNELTIARSFDALFSNGPRRDSSNFSPEVKGGLAFNIGGYTSKPIGKRITFKAGLNYEYYSTTMQVGSFVDSAKAVNQATGNLTMVNAYYRTGDQNKYTNAYHFLSLPLSIQWRINRNIKRSIIWENGATVARLIKTNALQYDPITRSYYKDESVQNKTQWMASSAVLFRFLTKNNRHVYAGPQVQYSFTNLIKEADNKHLRYAGLKIMTSLK